jgi:hypothetical protein
MLGSLNLLCGGNGGRLGISERTLEKWEQGRAKPKSAGG